LKSPRLFMFPASTTTHRWRRRANSIASAFAKGQANGLAQVSSTKARSFSDLSNVEQIEGMGRPRVRSGEVDERPARRLVEQHSGRWSSRIFRCGGGFIPEWGLEYFRTASRFSLLSSASVSVTVLNGHIHQVRPEERGEHHVSQRPMVPRPFCPTSTRDRLPAPPGPMKVPRLKKFEDGTWIDRGPLSSRRKHAIAVIDDPLES